MSKYYGIITRQNISRETFLVIIFIAWAWLSIAWAPLKSLALYKAIILTEILTTFALMAYLYSIRTMLLKYAKLAIIISGTYESIIAVSQFVFNRSLGIRFLGESVLSPTIPGVAKIVINGVKHIRPYGTFSHPNVLAAFLIIPIVFVINSLHENFPCDKESGKFVPRATLQNINRLVFYRVCILIVLMLGFFLTFSRSAYIGLFIALFLYFARFLTERKPYLKPRFLTLTILGALLIIIFVSHLDILSLGSIQSLQERLMYLNVSREIIYNNFLAGVGTGQFVYTEYLLHGTFQGWQFQPVHNLYLLIFSELGIIGISLFALIIFSILSLAKSLIEKDRNQYLTYAMYCVLLCFLFMALFDHFFWDIEQGMVIFLIPFFFILVGRNKFQTENVSQ